MDQDNYQQEIMNIPVNVADNGNVLNGSIKKKNMIEAICIALIGFFFWKILFCAFGLVVQVVCLFPFLALTIVALVGIRGESMLEYVLELIYFKKKRRVMIYKLPYEE